MRRILAACMGAIVLIAIALCIALAGPLGEVERSLGWNLGTYYVQVDNGKCIPTTKETRRRFGEEMTFEYRLEGVKGDGSTADLSFLTVRKLRDGAYLRLEVRPLLGVRSWEEVVWGEIPEPARAILSEPVPGTG